MSSPGCDFRGPLNREKIKKENLFIAFFLFRLTTDHTMVVTPHLVVELMSAVHADMRYLVTVLSPAVSVLEFIFWFFFFAENL